MHHAPVIPLPLSQYLSLRVNPPPNFGRVRKIKSSTEGSHRSCSYSSVRMSSLLNSMCCPLSLSLSLSCAVALRTLLRLLLLLSPSTRLGCLCYCSLDPAWLGGLCYCSLSLNSALLSQLRSAGFAAPLDSFSRHAAVEPVIT